MIIVIITFLFFRNIFIYTKLLFLPEPAYSPYGILDRNIVVLYTVFLLNALFPICRRRPVHRGFIIEIIVQNIIKIPEIRVRIEFLLFIAVFPVYKKHHCSDMPARSVSLDLITITCKILRSSFDNPQ